MDTKTILDELNKAIATQKPIARQISDVRKLRALLHEEVQRKEFEDAERICRRRDNMCRDVGRLLYEYTRGHTGVERVTRAVLALGEVAVIDFTDGDAILCGINGCSEAEAIERIVDRARHR